MEKRGTVKLIMVEADNGGVQNNKFYTQTDNGDGTWTAEWGRIGSTSSKKTYQISDWDKKQKEKIRKGYRDNTHLFVVDDGKKSFANISNSFVLNIINKLQSYAKKSVQQNYTVSSEAVTDKMVNVAQGLLNELSKLVTVNILADDINKILLELFRTIPRKMGNVRDYILDFKTVDNNNLVVVQDMMQREQDLLDVMAGQVHVNNVQSDQTDNELNILQALGIEIWEPTSVEVNKVKKLLAENSKRYRQAYCVKNIRTEKRFNDNLSSAKNKTTELLWHGSRNENWWSIIGSGLVLRPTNAVITGKMWGIGSYYSSKSGKSIGYSSLQGSYWAKGNDNTGFLSLYDVHIGHRLIIKRHDHWCSQLTWDSLRKKGDYDSVFAPAGYDLRNDESIVYREEQNTIKYMVELG